MYTVKNYRTKKALKDDFKAGTRIEVYQPGFTGEMYGSQKDGRVCIEGPHYPEPHRWYATVLIKDGVIVKVIG